MLQRTFIDLYEVITGIKCIDVLDADFLSDAIDSFENEIYFLNDEQVEEAIKLLTSFENAEISRSELSAAFASLLDSEYESAKRFCEQFDSFFNEVQNRIDGFFISRGFNKRERGKYERIDGDKFKGIEFCFRDDCSIDPGDVYAFPQLYCLRADSVDGCVLAAANGDAEKRNIASLIRIPKDDFDIFTAHPAAPKRSTASLQKRFIRTPLIVRYAYDGTIDDLGVLSADISSPEQLFDLLEPHLDAACAVLNGERPNKTHRKLTASASGFGSSHLFKLFVQCLLLTILAAIGCGALVLLLDLIFGTAPPLRFEQYLKAMLVCGMFFIPCGIVVFCAYLYFVRKGIIENSERF
ncbi:MAG: hypothetical protein II871_04955 [Clostridia bacterium]|nr:hypothetical protein [Clostridia bacterium]